MSNSVQRLRERRKAQGIVEAVVWLPENVRHAVAASVQEGRFNSKTEAMATAITDFFAREARS